MHSSPEPKDDRLESSLLEHARLGLKRIHSVCQVKDSSDGHSTRVEKNDVTKTTPKKKKEVKPEIKEDKAAEKKVVYLSMKKPVEKSIYYQHSKQGMKYWFEEQKSKTYNAKIPMGRKGTLLGLVDAPLK
ncbi:uncharacterized protein LOC143461650 [Clavelina lepadiformis]|uniref:uncharacterized protein LOC143461650 n=1 Tax=Clavelina lepadiformis TaxID=159417 RepID=UPI0040430654